MDQIKPSVKWNIHHDRNRQRIRDRSGTASKAAFVKADEAITIINTHGTQVVDTWCFMTDNLAAAMTEIGLIAPETPSPLNLWMNIPFTLDGKTDFCPPLSKPGDYVCLRAHHDVIVVMSTCPQDMVPINGQEMIVREVHYYVD